MSDTLAPETVTFVSKLHATIEADLSAKEDLLGITSRRIYSALAGLTSRPSRTSTILKCKFVKGMEASRGRCRLE